MRSIFLILLPLVAFSSCAADDTPVTAVAADPLASPVAWLCYGLAAGLLLSSIGHYLYRKSAARKRKAAPAAARRNRDTLGADTELEQKYYQLEALLRKTSDQNGALERELAECRRLAGAKERSYPEDTLPATVRPAAETATGIVTLYFLQPTRDGWFMESGQIGSAAEALYALTYESHNPEEASLIFIDRPGNVTLAVQNEQTWILAACNPVNLPLPDTRSIRTDTPGKAVCRNGSWEIVQKALITYVG